MPTQRYTQGGGVVNGILYVVGGFNGFVNLDTVEAYNPATDTWTTKAPMPTVRATPGVGVVNGILYAAGGNSEVNGTGTLSVVEAYDPVTNTWTTKAPMPATQSHFGVGVVNGILYTVGGISGQSAPYGGDGGTVAILQAYDPITNTWTTKAPMPTVRHTPGVGVVNGILYVAGGQGPSGTLTTVEAYDPITNTWTTKAPMPTSRQGPAGGVVNGILYVAGGYSYEVNDLVTTVEAYDPATNSWTTRVPIPTTRSYPGVGVVNGILYVVGGSTVRGSGPNGDGVLITNEAFTPEVTEITVAIDIKPGSFPNSINPRSRGKIPVAILTTDTFDAATVDPNTVLFGLTGTEAVPVHSAFEDVDGDGDTDMILHFNTQGTGIQCGDTSASLTGVTLDGQMIQGSDAINTVGCK